MQVEKQIDFKKKDDDLVYLNVSRKVVVSSLNLISMYGNLLLNNVHCKQTERLTMRQLVTMVDSFLRRVNVYNSKRYTPQEIKKHTDETEKQTDFLMNVLECANLAFDCPDTRKRILNRFEHIVSEENKRLSNKLKPTH